MDALIQLTVNDKRQNRKKDTKSGRKKDTKAQAKTSKKLKAKSKSLVESSKLKTATSQDEFVSKLCKDQRGNEASNGTSQRYQDNTEFSKINAHNDGNGVSPKVLSDYKELISDDVFIKSIDKVRKRIDELKNVSNDSENIVDKAAISASCSNISNIKRHHSNKYLKFSDQIGVNHLHAESNPNISHFTALDKDNTNESRAKNESIRSRSYPNTENVRQNSVQNASLNNSYADLFESLYSYEDQLENDFESALEVQNSDTVDSYDEEFGKNLFGEPDEYIVEAYNLPGEELFQTYVHIERTTVFDYVSEENNPQNYADEVIADRKQDSNSHEAVAGTSLEDVVDFIAREYESVCTNSESENIVLTIHEDKMEEIKNKNSTDFGERLFKYGEEEQYFVEAYNVVGEELCITFIEKLEESDTETLVQEDKEGHPVSSASQPHMFILEHKIPNGDPSVQNYISNLSAQYEDEVESPNFSEISRNANRNRVMEIHFDKQSNPRIERISIIPPKDDNNNHNNLRHNKAYMIIQELLQTEKQYISNLEKVIRDYMEYCRYTIVRQKRAEIFGNIKDILAKTREFRRALLKCNSHVEISETFLRFRSLFELYPNYFKNKPKSDLLISGECRQLLKDRQDALNDRLGLSSYLLNPIQRLGRYILLLENLQKNIPERCPTLNEAVILLKRTMQRGNDYVAIDSISECPCKLDLTSKGILLGREKFNMIKPKRQETTMFLFEDIVVFTVADHKNSEKFIYRDSIPMSDLSLVSTEGEDLIFQLKNFPECKKGKVDLYTFIFEAKDSKVQKFWTEMIQKRLWDQLVQCKNEKTSKLKQPIRREKTAEKTNKEELSRKISDTSKKMKRRSFFYVEDQKNYVTL